MSFTTLVDVSTLRGALALPAWTVVDCRHALADFSLGRTLYDEAHIPGAFFADVERDLSGKKTGKNGRHPMPNPETFAAFLRTLGVNDDTQLVAYDAGGDMFAARFWFLCRWIGHDAVAVLDGGMAAWTDAGYEVTAQPPPLRAAGSIVARPRNEYIVDANFVGDHLNDAAVRLLDARGSDRFAGRNETVDPVAGHIPGAYNRPFKDNFQDGLHFKTPEVLASEFDAIGDASTIVHQCGSGVSAAVNMLAMEIAQREHSRIYAGSWSEWVADPSRPIEGAPT